MKSFRFGFVIGCFLLRVQNCFGDSSEEILVIGNNAVDRVFFVNSEYGENGKRVATNMETYYGGQAANVAFTLAPCVKEKVTYVGVFGSDVDGEKSHVILEEGGVNVEALTIDCCSNNANIIVDVFTGDRLVTFYPAIAKSLEVDLDYKELVERDYSQVRYIYSDCRLFELSKKIFIEAKKHSIPIILDVEVINDENLQLITYADYLITNDSIIKSLSNKSDLKVALKSLIEKYHFEGVVATLGEKGCIGLDNSYHFIQESALDIQAVDTTGAGDAFHAAFIIALSNDMSFSEALHFSNFIASEKCKIHGPRLSINQLDCIRDTL